MRPHQPGGARPPAGMRLPIVVPISLIAEPSRATHAGRIACGPGPASSSSAPQHVPCLEGQTSCRASVWRIHGHRVLTQTRSRRCVVLRAPSRGDPCSNVGEIIGGSGARVRASPEISRDAWLGPRLGMRRDPQRYPRSPVDGHPALVGTDGARPAPQSVGHTPKL